MLFPGIDKTPPVTSKRPKIKLFTKLSLKKTENTKERTLNIIKLPEIKAIDKSAFERAFVNASEKGIKTGDFVLTGLKINFFLSAADNKPAAKDANI